MIHANKTFTDYLREAHADTYDGLDDDMEYDFELWLEDRDPQDMIELGDGFAKERVEDFVKLAKEIKFQHQKQGECVGCVGRAFKLFTNN